MRKGDETMKKTILTSILITAAVILLFTFMMMIGKPEQQTVNVQIPVKVEDNRIADTAGYPIYFSPVGKKCSIKVTNDLEEGYSVNVKVTASSTDSEPLYVSGATGKTVNTGELNVDGNCFYVILEPVLNDNFTSEDSELLINFWIDLDVTEGSAAVSDEWTNIKKGLMIPVALEVIGFAVLILIFINKNVERDYDERQLKARGTVSLYALVITMMIAVGIGFIGEMSGEGLISMGDSGLLIGITGFFAFIILSDMNDAFTGFTKRKVPRVPFTILYVFLGILNLVIGISQFITTRYERFNVCSICIGFVILVLGIEMIVKGIRDKKEAMADEES